MSELKSYPRDYEHTIIDGKPDSSRGPGVRVLTRCEGTWPVSPEGRSR